MRNDNVQDLIAQLNRLQVQQTTLLVRLGRATDNEFGHEANGTRESEHEVNGTREFSVGDKVLIKNPNPFQANKGTITKIGKKRITVTTASGSKILRAPKNLALQP
jgi:hypothetical protein